MAGNLYRSRGHNPLRTAFLLPYFSWLSNFVTIPCQYRIVSRISARSARVSVLLPIVYDWFVVQASSASSHASRWVFAVFNVIPAIIKYLHSFFCPFSFSGRCCFAVCLVSLAEPREFLWCGKHSSGSPGLHFSCGRRLLYATQNGRPFCRPAPVFLRVKPMK